MAKSIPNFSEQPVLFANVPIGSWFRKVGTHSVYQKTTGWKACRVNAAGNAIGNDVRIPAGTVCFVATWQ